MKINNYKNLTLTDYTDILESLSYTIADVKKDDPERAERLRKIIKDMENRWESQ